MDDDSMPVGQDLLERIRRTTCPTAPIPWFMDLDGVLNVIGRRPTVGWQWYERVAVMTDEDAAVPVVYAPMLIECLNEMAACELIEVHWLTTWEWRAPRRFAPSVGLQVGQRVIEDPTGISSFGWKLAAVLKRQVLPSDPGWSPFVWTDDQIGADDDAHELMRLSREQAVVISPDEEHGLTPGNVSEILNAIDYWAALPAVIARRL
jgi:hypothetical protein